MISAKEAANISNGAVSTILADIEERIKTAAKAGMFKCSLTVDADTNIVYEVLGKLRDAGYTTNESSTYESTVSFGLKWRTYITVDWSGKNIKKK